MSESATIARPYAQALFRLAKEGNSLSAWSDRLQRLAILVRDPEMDKVIANPRFSTRQVAELFVSLSGEAGNRELGSFISLLAENARFDVLAEIQEGFEQLRSADEGVRDALITSAFPIETPQLRPLMQQLEAHFGCRLQPVVEIDASLIGGVRVAVGDQLLDASVRGKLDAMATALKS